MWANLERLSDALTSLKAGFLQWKPGRRSKDLAMECMTSCLHLAQYFNQGNDLVVDLCRRICALQSIITGDACRSFPRSRKSMAVCSALTENTSLRHLDLPWAFSFRANLPGAALAGTKQQYLPALAVLRVQEMVVCLYLCKRQDS